MKAMASNIKLLGVLFVFILAACGESKVDSVQVQIQQSITEFNPDAYKIRIQPGAALLTGIEDTMQLTAKIYNQNGNEISSNIIWSSSKPDVVKVDNTGKILALALGSSQITAHTPDVKSVPVIVSVTVPADGVIIISDDQILSSPKPVGAPSKFGTGIIYEVLVRDIDLLEPGTLVSGNGEKPLAGEIVAATHAGSNVLLTLKVVPVSQLFPHLTINEKIDLNTAESEIPDEINEHFNVTTSPDGTITLTPKSGDSVKFKRNEKQ